MMGLTHMVVSGAATSLVLGNSNLALITVGAIAGLLPDVDISTSPAGRVLPWVANWLERRFPHRSCTHSLLASTVVASVTYGVAYLLANGKYLQVADAITTGYFFGWFIDMFTKSGVEMFWPSRERYVCPGNRKFRLKSGGSAEYVLLIILVAIALFIFNINASGGVMTQFNRLIASPAGVTEIYNHYSSTHLVVAHIKGVRAGDRSPLNGDFTIIEARGQDFIVQSSTGQIYKVGLDNSAQIIAEQITADVTAPAITNLEPLTLDDDPLASSLEKFNHPGAMVFLSGEIKIDDAEDVKYTPDPFQFPYIKLSAESLTLEAAPLTKVLNYFSDQYATGQLQVRIINGKAATNPNSQTQFQNSGT